MDALQILSIAWPLVLIQVGLQIYALIDLFKKKKTKNLSVLVWAIIIILGEILGAAAYLLFGRAED